MRGNTAVMACLADVHFDDPWAWRLLEELRSEFLEPLREIREELDAVLILGDLFHRRVSMNGAAAAAVLMFMRELLRITNPDPPHGRKIPVRILRGTVTHDHSMLESFKFMESDGVEVADTVCTEEMELTSVVTPDNPVEEEYVFNLLYLPEEYPQDWREYYADVLPPRSGKPFDVIFGHGMVDFAAHSSLLLESERPIKSAVVFPTGTLVQSAAVSVFGHVHVAQSHKTVHYCGSFSRFAFGEDQPKGWILLELDGEGGGTKVIRKKNTKAPEYRTVGLYDLIEADEDVESAAGKISTILEGCNLRMVVGTDITPELSSRISVLREHFAEDPRLKIERKLVKATEPEAGSEDDGLNFVRQRELPVDETIHRHINETKPSLGLTLEEVRTIIAPGEQAADAG
jgi:DNA repair exonuclease SbcCD nuclease subunit